MRCRGGDESTCLRLASRNLGHTSNLPRQKVQLNLSLDCATLERDKGMIEDGIWWE